MKRSRQQRLRELGRDALWLILPLAGLVLSIAMTLRLGLLEPDPPRQPEKSCGYSGNTRYVRLRGTVTGALGPAIATQMAFVYYESSFRSHARPPREKLLGFILNALHRAGLLPGAGPGLERISGPGQRWAIALRTDMEYALDFIGCITGSAMSNWTLR